jgi:hypothetical protein
MSLIWFCACAYLLVGIIGLLEAEVRVKPGSTPLAVQIAWSTLCFALTYPASAMMRWIMLRTRP